MEYDREDGRKPAVAGEPGDPKATGPVNADGPSKTSIVHPGPKPTEPEARPIRQQPDDPHNVDTPKHVTERAPHEGTHRHRGFRDEYND